MRVIAFYSFFDISDPKKLKEEINLFFLLKKIKGSILVSKEGLNGTITVTQKKEKNTINYLISLGVLNQNIKISNYYGREIFKEFKIKLKNEIVTSDFGLKISEIKQSKFIQPNDWDKFINKKDVKIIDTRNNYEYKIGHFKNAINPKIDTFKEFNEYIKTNKDQFQNKKVAIYCTGGIRCEKAGPLMERYGIDTYQLKGGILKYFEQTNSKLWNGECFVFDYRVSLTKELSKGISKLCYGCNTPLTIKETKSPKYEKGFTCPVCFDNMTEKKRRSLKDKREHWKKVF
ncbi:rhodanese-like domain-containing protein [Alphaproteobacteria bacterium]|nr:rhodanese-like domain-containing protein [Alphaproteobacteria bacterium]